MNVPAGQGPNGRLPAASAAARAPRPGLRPGPRACVVRACVRAGARRPRASARACPLPPSPRPRGARSGAGRALAFVPRPRRTGWRGEGRPARARRRWEAGVGAGLSLGSAGRARSPRRVCPGVGGVPGAACLSRAAPPGWAAAAPRPLQERRGDARDCELPSPRLPGEMAREPVGGIKN